MERFTHVFEAGRRGKPDELDWQIAQLMAGHCISIDRNARCNLRVEGGWNLERDMPNLIVRGEVSQHLLELPSFTKDLTGIAIGHYNRINRTALTTLDMHYDALNPQAAALAENARHEKSGDSGSGVGIAVHGNELMLPHERYIAKGIANLIDEIYQADGRVPRRLANADVERIEGMRADGKAEVVATYIDGRLHKVREVTIAINHEPSLSVGELRERVEPVVLEYLEQYGRQIGLATMETPRVYINGAGAWTDEGGWKKDAGNCDAKPHREWFGTWGVNEDSGAGEDPSKPSMTGTLLARHIAVQVVGAGLADMARALVKFNIGEKYPSFVEVNTYGTGREDQDAIEKRVREWLSDDKIPHSLSDTVRAFDLRNPERYAAFAHASDYFHARGLPWNAVVVR